MKTFKKKLITCVLINIVWSFGIVTMFAGEPVNPPQPNKTVSILTIGNSFANNALTWLPQITESVPGYEIIVTRANLGGCSLERHVNLIKGCVDNPASKPYPDGYCLKDLLVKDNYDYVTIQQVSLLSFKSESFYPYADILYDFIKEQAPHSRVIIHQTWAYSPASTRLAEWEMPRKEMHDSLVMSYNKLAEHLNIDILPSGNAFYRSFQKRPDIDLWAKDGYHASTNGCYLAGCVWFGKFFEISPKKVKFVPEDMSHETAKFLRKVAAREVRKSR